MLGIYIRKSRDRKKEKSLKEQKLLGQEFALENDFKYQFYDEGIISGQKNKEQRPKFAELLKDIENGKISGVYIWDSSRLARNEIAWHTFADLLRDKNTYLYDNGVIADFRNENTYLFYTIKAGMDAHFARITAKKIKTVLKRNAMEGIPHGITPYGYTTDENGKWKINENEGDTIRIIFDLYQKGYGYIRIANHLNELGIDTRYKIEWTPSTIRYMIYNKTYSGIAKFNDIEIKVPAIIEKRRHDKLIKSISNRYKKPGAKSKKYILNELMVCGKCGSRYTISQRHRHSYYRCLSEVNRGVEKCFSKAISANPIDILIFNHILLGEELYELARKTYLEGGNIDQKKQLQKKLSYYEKKLDKVRGELKRNHQLYVMGAVELELYLIEKKRIDTQMFKAEKNIEIISEDIHKLKDTDRILEQMTFDFSIAKTPKDRYLLELIAKNRLKDGRLEKQEILENMTNEEKIKMVEKYIKQITIDFPSTPLKIKIEFKIPVSSMEIIMESRYYGAKNLTTGKNYYLKDFGKDPKRIYKRMFSEFRSYQNRI